MKRDEFDKNMTQLLSLLKKILKSYPKGSQFSNFLDPQHLDKVNLNICFFNLLPLSAEDLDEFEEAYSELLDQNHSDDSEAEISDFDWTQNDMDFLKRNGMTF